MNTDMVQVSQVPVEGTIADRTELAWPDRAKSLQIVDAATLATADEERLACLEFIRSIHAEEDPLCKRLWDAWQHQLAHRAERLKPFEDSVKVYDERMKAWDLAEKQRARERQRQIEQAAYEATVVEQEKRIEHVEATGGSAVEVRSVLERPVTLPVAPTRVLETPAAPVRASGSKVVANWKGEITDQTAFILFAVLGNEPPPEVQKWVDAHLRRDLLVMLQADKGAVLQIARAVKDSTVIPGLRIWDDGKVQSTPKKGGA